VERTIDVIRESSADIIAMQETNGAGAVIADSLDYFFYLRSSMSADDNTNHSIMSRFPITTVDRAFNSFMSGGGCVQKAGESIGSTTRETASVPSPPTCTGGTR